MKRKGLLSLARGSIQDLFDQDTAFGRLALVHVLMMAGDTFVTVSLAGSLFFSVSPDEAKSKVLAYLLLTFAPFAVVSPLLGPLIDKSANGRRILVALSACVRAVFCWMMATHLTSLWLFPMAFIVLISQKLYTVTRGALVPEMARTDQLNAHTKSIAADGWPSDESAPEPQGFAGFNAQLTLLGAVIGLLAGAVAASLLKSIGASSDLVSASVVYVVATIASVRLQKPAKSLTKSKVATTSDERDRQLLNPNGDREVSWGLTAMALVRFSVGFATFLLAFGLRREHAGLSWFAFALSFSGIGAMLGLAVVTRVRSSLKESTLLTWAILFVGAGGVLASMHSSLWSQIGLAGWLGFCGAVAQPSFDAITQRHVPAGTQGRTFARFAVRQQLLWVIGALLPVGFTMTFSFGDRLLGCLMLVTGLFYGLGRRFAR